MKDKYFEFWQHKIINSSKLSFFCTFKKGYKMEQYLSIIENLTIRRTLCQYRVINHKLQIERGRYENIPQDQRICKFCNSSEVENEYHFALTCQKYEDLGINSDNTLKKYFYLKNLTFCLSSLRRLKLKWMTANMCLKIGKKFVNCSYGTTIL